MLNGFTCSKFNASKTHFFYEETHPTFRRFQGCNGSLLWNQCPEPDFSIQSSLSSFTINRGDLNWLSIKCSSLALTISIYFPIKCCTTCKNFQKHCSSLLQIMSNGIFKRVLTNAEQEKNTLAIFIMPDVAVGIGPVEKLINEERPRAYKDIKNYVALFFQSYQQGKIPIEAAKISN